MQPLIDAVIAGDAKQTGILVRRMLASGCSPNDVLYNGLLKAMNVLGSEFMNNEVFIAEVIRASQAWNCGYMIMKEAMSDETAKPLGRVIIATVEGDIHDIGKNLVKLFMEAIGVEVVDLGVDTTAEMIVDAVKEHRPDILALSALLTTTMKYQKLIIERLESAGLRDGLIIFVGGAPITREFCKEIGADHFYKDAAEAAEAARLIMEKER
jgi:5-methyltetrahydrofolate--homocysteine methyltransferase